MSEKKQRVSREIRAYEGNVHDIAKEVTNLSKNYFVRVLTTTVDVKTKDAVFVVAINIPEPVKAKDEPLKPTPAPSTATKTKMKESV